MVVNERSRRELYGQLEEVLGADTASALIEHLPPVSMVDVATKHDLAGLEQRIALRFDLVDERFNRVDDSIRAATSDLRASFEHEMRAQSSSFQQEMRAQSTSFEQEMRAQSTSFEQEMRAHATTFGRELRSQTTTMVFSLVGVVLTMAALAFALARFV